MKIVLIYAKDQVLAAKADACSSPDRHVNHVTVVDEIYPALGITTLAAWLEQDGHEVRLRDDSIDDMRELRRQMEWADVVGISALTPNAKRGRELGRISRLEIGRPTIFGGPHPTSCPEYFLDGEAADVCVLGEGDITFPELLQVLDQPELWADVAGIVYKQDGELVRTAKRPLLKDMDSVPFPAYHLWDIDRYMGLAQKPVLTIVSSRGCPYSCTFCDPAMTPHLYRSMSANRTVDLMEHLTKTYEPLQLVFFDDLFTIQRDRVLAISKELLRRGTYIEWTCESRVDTMDFELLRWMRRAGCVKVYYGLESGSPDLLLTMKKRVTPEKIRAGAKLNRQLGMYFRFFILYGFPEETARDHSCTEELITATRPDAVTVSLLQPIPGTAVFEQLKGRLLTDVTELQFHYWHANEPFKHPVFEYDELKQARERLIELHRRATSGLWSRFRRKIERFGAMVSHPYLLLDLYELRSRKRHSLRQRFT